MYNRRLKKTLFIFFILASTLNVVAQSDSLMILHKEISFYENGVPKKLVTYSLDSCLYIDRDIDIPDYYDYCRDGLYGAGQVIVNRFDFPENAWVESIKDLQTGTIYTYGNFRLQFPNLCVK